MSVRVFHGLVGCLVVLSLTGCPEEDDGHGYVGVQLLAPMSSESDLYAGTSRVQIKLDYEDCLVNWYTQNPDYLSNGTEGAPIFEDWREKLCSVDLPPDKVMADCAVGSPGFTHSAMQLRVDYDINNSELAARVIPFGPVPCDRITDCDGMSTVQARTFDAVQGFVGGTIAWQVGTFPQRYGGCDQGASIQIGPTSAD